jgi:hypothetical protein
VALLLNSASAATPAPQPAPVSGVTLPADTAASLSTDAGVVATLSGAPALPADSTTQLYDNLAALAVAPAPAAPAGGAEAAVDVNAEWASVLQTTPALAPVAAQMGVDASIVDTLA